MALREYDYVGPSSIAQQVIESDSGRVIASKRDILDWLAERGAGTDEFVTTFVIDPDICLRIADRRSEHVACAGGGRVLSAGEMTFIRDHDQIEVVAVSNQSTGYCPQSTSWPAVETALDTIPLIHPGGFTYAVEFRRCEECGERNVVKEDWFVCAMCDANLPAEWNLHLPIRASKQAAQVVNQDTMHSKRLAPHYSVQKEQLIEAVSGLFEVGRDYSAPQIDDSIRRYLRGEPQRCKTRAA